MFSFNFIQQIRINHWIKNLLAFVLLYKWVYETAGEDSFVCIEKAEKILGYKPNFSNKDALVRNFEW